MSEQAILSDFSRICHVLDILDVHPEYAPYGRKFDEEFNKTKDRIKVRTLRIERAWDWRDRVFKSFHCSLVDPQSCNQMAFFAHRWILQKYFCHRMNPMIVGRRAPLSKNQCFAWWTYYWEHRYMRDLDKAVNVIVGNFEKWDVWGEEE